MLITGFFKDKNEKMKHCKAKYPPGINISFFPSNKKIILTTTPVTAYLGAKTLNAFGK